jgi:hypothetical protein
MAGFTRECIDGLLTIARDEQNVEPKDRITAYKWLAEQVIGKPNMTITGEDGGPIRVDAEALDELRALAERLKAK